jgi:hypothetical protein
VAIAEPGRGGELGEGIAVVRLAPGGPGCGWPAKAGLHHGLAHQLHGALDTDSAGLGMGQPVLRALTMMPARRTSCSACWWCSNAVQQLASTSRSISPIMPRLSRSGTRRSISCARSGRGRRAAPAASARAWARPGSGAACRIALEQLDHGRLRSQWPLAEMRTPYPIGRSAVSPRAPCRSCRTYAGRRGTLATTGPAGTAHPRTAAAAARRGRWP